jgi:drug/metabolite transporter (DMT)-like permease
VKTLVVLVFAALAGAVAETLFSYGMRSFGEMDWSKPSRWIDLILVVPRNPTILIGVIFAAGFFFLYLTALSWADLSYAMPITALSFLFAAFFARIFLREDISWRRWVGILLIVAGVMLVALERRQSTLRAPSGEPLRDLGRAAGAGR